MVADSDQRPGRPLDPRPVGAGPRPSRRRPEPARQRLRTGRARRSEWVSGSTTMHEVLLAPVQTAISFWNGMNRLVGDLVLPPWAGPHPVAIFVDGYGPGGRDQGSWPQRLAAAGIASFAYDKPGCGDSTGDWSVQTLPERAAETAAAIAMVRGHPAIADDAVALLGSGQGGWVSLLVAEAGDSPVAAVVVTSTAAVGSLALEQFRLAQRLTEHGFSAPEVALAQALLRERIRRLSVGEGPSSVIAAEAACHRAPWYRLMPGATPEEIAYLARLASFDPGPAVRALRAPLLALYGCDDVHLPVEENSHRLLETLHRSGHRDHEVVLVPGADHGLRVYVGSGPAALVDGRYVPSEVAPGVFELIVTWLDRRLGQVDAPMTAAQR